MTEEEAIRQSGRDLIEAGYIVETWENGERVWTITESGRDYLARVQEHTDD